MPSVKSTYSSSRLKAEDIRGKDCVLTITEAPGEDCARRGEKADMKIVLYFHGTDKTLPLNVINSNTIADLYGDNSDLWGGKQVTLYQTMTDMEGKRVECIRIRTAAELGGAPAAIANVEFGTPISPPTTTIANVAVAVPAQPAAGTAPIVEEEIPF